MDYKRTVEAKAFTQYTRQARITKYGTSKPRRIETYGRKAGSK